MTRILDLLEKKILTLMGAAMNRELIDLEARVRREKEAWSTQSISEAQGFKVKFAAAFENAHKEKLEAERDQIIRQKCPSASVLDYGCYEGHETQRYLDFGAAHVSGIDISDEAIDRARLAVTSPRAEFLVADAHHLPFEDNSFDLVVGRAILHHLDLKTAYQEISRVLKPGGLALFVEPLRGNPLAKIARLLTPNARTKDELPLDRLDIQLGNELIGPGEHHFSGFVSSPVGAIVALFGGGGGSWIMKLASAGDDIAGNTPAKYWGRLVYLSFQKHAA
jgi:SAM-dependent methyltransferase